MPIPAGPFARYRASSLTLTDGDPVSLWVDEGSGGNDATAAGVNRPTYRAAAFNGYPAVEFDAIDDRLQTADYGVALAQPSTQVIMGEFISYNPANPASVYLSDGKAAGRNFIGIAAAGDQYRLFSGSAVNGTSGPVVETDVCIVGIFNAASSDLFLNTVDIFAGVSPGVQALAGLTIGHRFADDASSQPANFRYVEILVYDRILDAADRTDLQAYFQETWIDPPPSIPDAITTRRPSNYRYFRQLIGAL